MNDKMLKKLIDPAHLRNIIDKNDELNYIIQKASLNAIKMQKEIDWLKNQLEEKQATIDSMLKKSFKKNSGLNAEIKNKLEKIDGLVNKINESNNKIEKLQTSNYILEDENQKLQQLERENEKLKSREDQQLYDKRIKVKYRDLYREQINESEKLKKENELLKTKAVLKAPAKISDQEMNINKLELERDNDRKKIKHLKDHVSALMKKLNAIKTDEKTEKENVKLKKTNKVLVAKLTVTNQINENIKKENKEFEEQTKYTNKLINTIYNYLYKLESEEDLKQIIFKDYGQKYLSNILVSSNNLYDFLIKKNEE